MLIIKKEVISIINLNDLDTILNSNLDRLSKLKEIRKKIFDKDQGSEELDIGYYLYELINKRALRYLSGHFFGKIIQKELKSKDKINISNCYVSNETQEKIKAYNKKVMELIFSDWSENYLNKEHAFYDLYMGFVVSNDLENNKIYIIRGD